MLLEQTVCIWQVNGSKIYSQGIVSDGTHYKQTDEINIRSVSFRSVFPGKNNANHLMEVTLNVNHLMEVTPKSKRRFSHNGIIIPAIKDPLT